VYRYFILTWPCLMAGGMAFRRMNEGGLESVCWEARDIGE
jgi:hypothetical protein